MRSIAQIRWLKFRLYGFGITKKNVIPIIREEWVGGYPYTLSYIYTFLFY